MALDLKPLMTQPRAAGAAREGESSSGGWMTPEEQEAALEEQRKSWARQDMD